MTATANGNVPYHLEGPKDPNGYKVSIAAWICLTVMVLGMAQCQMRSNGAEAQATLAEHHK